MTNVPDRKSVMAALLDIKPQFKRSTVGDAPYAIPLTPVDKLKKFHNEKLLDQGSPTSRNFNYDNVFEPTSPRANPATARMFDAAIHNAKRKFSPQTLLQENNRELETLWGQGNALDKAIKLRQKSWDQIPSKGADVGAAMGLLFGASHE